MIGKTISHYKILDKLGEGGMGVVYKAIDTKLERTVAIKVLRPEAMGDPAAKARFIREAKAASALNHPNITTIHEIGEWHGRDFICMEYIEGQTVKQKIKSGEMALDEVLSIAAQVAEALREAHEHDITHRDIKSENIMVTPKGQVKVMDFGLAKLKGNGSLTKAGTTLGTISYMSPEQTRGEDVDHRTDIWSFGVVLYEMITGNLPFKGEYEQAVIYSILNEEPKSVQKLHPNISSEFLSVLNKTLEKEPEIRYQSAQETLMDLKRLKIEEEKATAVHKILASKSEEIEQVKPAKLSKNFLFIGALLCTFILVVVVVIIFKPFSRESIKPPTTVPFTSLLGDEQRPAFSPNSSQIAFIWNGEDQDNFDIYVKEIGIGGYPTRLTNHPGYDFCPVWSPDGKFIVFGRSYKGRDDIYIMSALGKSERKFCETNWIGINYLAWSHDGKFLAVTAQDSTQNPYRIYLLSTNNFEIKRLTSPTDLSHDDYECAISPDNKKVAFIRYNASYNGNIFIVPVTGGEPERVTFYNSWLRGLAWTKEGKAIIFSSNHKGNSSLWKITIAGGAAEQLAASRLDLAYPAIARTGDLLAYEEATWNFNIYRIDLQQKGKKKPVQFISSSRPDAFLDYSPDGKKIVFSSWRSGPLEVWICDSDGNNPIQLTFFNGPWAGNPKWSPDGNKIAFDVRIEGPPNIFVMDADGSQPKRLTTATAYESAVNWSIDGQWIYFQSNRSGKEQIWKISPEGGDPIQITEQGGYAPQLSPDGKWIYYVNHWNIWRKTVAAGEECTFLNVDVGEHEWVLCDDGIFYEKRHEDSYSVEFYNFKTGTAETIADGLPKEWMLGFAVSRDGKWLFYSQQESTAGDIALVENFR